MFKATRLQARLELQAAQNRDTERRMMELRQDPYYCLAQDLKRDIDQVVATGYMDHEVMKKAQDEAIERRRAILLAERTNALVEEEVNRAIAEQRAKIEAEAQAAARELARLAVDKFNQEQGETYRAELIERLARRGAAAAQALARHQIREEVQNETGQHVSETTPITEDERETRKARAKELRDKTKKTDMLPLGWLQEDDVVTFGFTSKGNGHEPLTENDGWYNRSRTELLVRKLSCRLLDLENGVAVITSDSWLDDSTHRTDAIRAGRQVVISADDPDTHEPSPTLIKGEPLDLQDIDGTSVGNISNLDLWWVDLGEFRAMS